MDITERHLHLLSDEGFSRLYEQERLMFDTNLQAYLALEDEYRRFIKESGLDDIFDDRRYSSYNSFQTTRGRKIKRRQKVR